jgi:hypothetical protein
VKGHPTGTACESSLREATIFPACQGCTQKNTDKISVQQQAKKLVLSSNKSRTGLSLKIALSGLSCLNIKEKMN